MTPRRFQQHNRIAGGRRDPPRLAQKLSDRAGMLDHMPANDRSVSGSGVRSGNAAPIKARLLPLEGRGPLTGCVIPGASAGPCKTCSSPRGRVSRPIGTAGREGYLPFRSRSISLSESQTRLTWPGVRFKAEGRFKA
jgi:hypothetical protein